MRVCLMSASVAALLLGASAPASAAWKDYTFPDLSLGKEFPAEPVRRTVEYKTPVAGTAKATELAVTEDNIEYKVIVAELQNKVEMGASIMGECVANAELEGEVLANMGTRIGPGAKAVHGRIVSVNLDRDKGRRQTACLYTQGRLYQIQATVLPAHGQPNSSQVIRFVNSLRFDLVTDWSKVDRNLNEAAAAN